MGSKLYTSGEIDRVSSLITYARIMCEAETINVGMNKETLQLIEDALEIFMSYRWRPIEDLDYQEEETHVLCRWEDGDIETYPVEWIADWQSSKNKSKITHFAYIPEPPITNATEEGTADSIRESRGE